MIKERILKIFLYLPILNQLTEFFLDTAIKRFSLKQAWQNLQFKPRNLIELKEEYKNTKNFHWLIQISAPSGPNSLLWGDTYFAQEISNSLTKLNQEAQIIYRDQEVQKFVKANTVLLNLRGLLPLSKINNKINLIWVISHPNQLTKRELQKYNLIFAASHFWANKKSKTWGLKIDALLQATNPTLFNTKTNQPAFEDRILFVGNTRGIYRKSVKMARTLVKNLVVIGTGWGKYIPEDAILKDFVDNKNLSSEYRKSKYVLTDHWDDMARNGFISNRLFDAVASGTRIISDYVPGSKDIFQSSITEYRNLDELSEILKSDISSKFGSQEEIDSIAQKIQLEHNFDERASYLLSCVLDFTR